MFVILLAFVTTLTQIILNYWALSTDNRAAIYFILQMGLNGMKGVITLGLAKVLMDSRLFQSIHDDMVLSLMFSPLSYFEKTPSEKIINRLSSDLNINDKIITTEFGFMLTNLQLFLSALISIMFVYFLFGTYFYMLFLWVVIAIALYFLSYYFSLSIVVNKLDS
ncbi:MAG: hypothetical protein KDD45_02980 [Bdellovibrionales bacterium]|nr:hypothetical protein [Bdellovibrionales bacterium]